MAGFAFLPGHWALAQAQEESLPASLSAEVPALSTIV
jgi:hypothetical protein